MNDNPYYIVCPPYNRSSAGTKVLYRFCDMINKLGYSAFVYQRPYGSPYLASSPSDVAPFLNQKIVDYHFKLGITPIVVYPETINIKKFSAPCRVRYILNYDNFLFENASLDSDDYLLAYSQNIAGNLTTQTPFQILNLPVSDPNFFVPPENEKRSGGVFYAGKFKYHFGGKTLPITKGMVEITRDRFDSQTPEEIRNLFQGAEYFYTYEDTALVLEAMLCGCPVVLIPNEFFNESLAARELDGLGYAWGYSLEQLQHAKATVGLVRDRYFYLISQANKDLSKFIIKSQKIADNIPYRVPFANGYIHNPSFFQLAIDLIRLIKDILQDRGVKKTFSILFKRLRAFRFRLY